LFYTTSKFGIDYVYSNITVPTAGISSLRVDGTPLPAAQIKVHPNNPAYSVAFATLTNIDMQHTISCDSTFTGIVYGLGYFESYAYNVGTLINNLNAIVQIKNVNSTVSDVDSFTCKQTPFRLFIKVAYPLTSIHWKLSQVAGISPNTDSVINTPIPILTEIINGRTYYTYTLQQDFTIIDPGTYYLPVTYTAPEIDNCGHTDNCNIELVVKLPPVADFSVPAINCLKDTVHFIHVPVAGPLPSAITCGILMMLQRNQPLMQVNCLQRQAFKMYGIVFMQIMVALVIQQRQSISFQTQQLLLEPAHRSAQVILF